MAASYAVTLALKFKTQAAAPLMQAGVFMAVLFTTSYAPQPLLTGWLKTWPRYNPVTQILEAVRQGFVGEVTWSDTWPGLLALAGLAALVVALAMRGLRSHLRLAPRAARPPANGARTARGGSNIGSMPQLADTLDIDTLNLRSGAGTRFDAEVRIEPLQAAGQNYAVVGGRVDARVDVSRTSSGLRASGFASTPRSRARACAAWPMRVR